MSESADLIARASIPPRGKGRGELVFPHPSSSVRGRGSIYLNSSPLRSRTTTRGLYQSGSVKFLGWCDVRGVTLKQVEP